MSVPETQPTPVRLGILGCGNIVRNVHAAHLAALPAIRVRACMDLAADNARRVAEAVGAEYHTADLERVLGDPAVEAVLIATPAETHVALSLRALAAGKAVFCEKPMGSDLEECRRLARRLEADPAPYMVGYCYRFNRAVARVFPLVRPGFSWVHVIAPMEGGGLYGGWINNLCHALDLVRMFHRCEPLEIRAEGDGPPGRKVDAGNPARLAVTVRFRDASLAVIALGQANPSVFLGKWYYKFCGADGRTAEVVNYRRATFRSPDPREALDESDEAGYHSGHRAELELFAACLRRRAPMPVSVRDAFMANAMLAAVRLAYEEGRSVRMDEDALAWPGGERGAP